MISKNNWLGKAVSMLLAFILSFTTMLSGFGREALAKANDYPKGEKFYHFDFETAETFYLYKGGKIIAEEKIKYSDVFGKKDKITVTGKYADGKTVDVNIVSKLLTPSGKKVQYRLTGKFYSGTENKPIYYTLTYPVTFKVDGKDYTVNFSQTLDFFCDENNCHEKITKGIDFDLPSTAVINEYKVTFVNGEEIVKVETVEEGGNATAPLVTKDETDYASYTFDKWVDAKGKEVSLNNITKNMTVYASYTENVKKYTIKFLYDNGTVLSEKTYAYGDVITIPNVPEKKETELYKFENGKWTPSVSATCKGNATYKAGYTETQKEYKVSYVVNGKTTTVTLAAGTTAESVKNNAPEVPASYSDEKNVYNFVKWDKEFSKVTGNEVYTAVYESTARTYTVVFKNISGKVISSNNYAYGDAVTIPKTPTYDKDKDIYKHSFAGWDKAVSTTCTGNAEYTAIYTDEIALNYYVFKVPVDSKDKLYDRDYIEGRPSSDFTHAGKSISIKITDENREKYSGLIASLQAAFTKPEGYTRYGSNVESVIYNIVDNTYEIAGIERDLVDCWYVVKLEADGWHIDGANLSKYTIKFVDSDDSVISENVYKAGESIVVPADPTKEADKTYTYKFAGWDNSISETAVADAIYTATYDKEYIEYTVKFVSDGKEISSKDGYHYGDSVVVPAEPTKESDKTNTYKFVGWDKEITKVTGNVTYYAVFESDAIDYNVTFVDYDGTLISSVNYNYGDEVFVPEDPERAADNTYTYKFAGWDNEVTEVTKDAVYTATYDSTFIEYTVNFVSEEKDISSKNYHYGDTVDVPAEPAKEADKVNTYKFVGWDKEITKVTGNTTYYAQYKSEAIDYTVKFVDYDGTLISSVNYNYGDEVSVPADPEREADETYTYKFTGWDKEIVKVAEDTTYTATYEQKEIVPEKEPEVEADEDVTDPEPVKPVVPERKPEVEADEDVTDPEPVKPVVPERKPEVEADEDVKTGDSNISLYVALLGLGLVSSITVLSEKKKEQND